MNKYKNLIDDLNNKLGLDVENYLFRISMMNDLERVKLYGSSRVGISNNLWDKIKLLKNYFLNILYIIMI